MNFNTIKYIFVAFTLMLLTSCASMGAQPSFRTLDVRQSADVVSEKITAPGMNLDLPPVLALAKPHPPARAAPIVDSTQIQCLALAIYFEARGETSRGKAGVGYVVLNRVGHDKYPDSICGVVHQKIGRSCQFSWYCDGKPDVPKDQDAYRLAYQVALSVINGEVENPVNDSLFFRHKAVGFKYAAKLKLRASIGNHRFFAAI